MDMVRGIDKDSDIPEDTLGVDDEETAESDTFILEKDTIIAGDGHVSVGDEREFEVGAETTLLPRLVSPCKVRVLRVGRDT